MQEMMFTQAVELCDELDNDCNGLIDQEEEQSNYRNNMPIPMVMVMAVSRCLYKIAHPQKGGCLIVV